MSTKYRAAIGAIFATGLTASLAGLLARPATAAPPPAATQTAGASPAHFEPSSDPESQARTISTHGSWTAVCIGRMLLVIDEFEDGSHFAIVDRADGKFGLVLSSPRWHLTKGMRLRMTINIDGRVFSGDVQVISETMLALDDVGKEFVVALYGGQRATIEVGQYSAEVTQLADAAAAIDDAVRYQVAAAR